MHLILRFAAYLDKNYPGKALPLLTPFSIYEPQGINYPTGRQGRYRKRQAISDPEGENAYRGQKQCRCDSYCLAGEHVLTAPLKES